jgi:hypothetical protein
MSIIDDIQSGDAEITGVTIEPTETLVAQTREAVQRMRATRADSPCGRDVWAEGGRRNDLRGHRNRRADLPPLSPTHTAPPSGQARPLAQFQKLRQRLEHLRAGSREAESENRPNRQRADAAAPQETFSIRCYRLCASCTQRIALLGPGAVTRDEPFYIVA